MNATIPAFMQGILIILISPLVIGLERFLVARLQGRPRAMRFLLQPYVDLVKLLRIKPVRPVHASWFFGLAPTLLWGVMVFLAFTVPILWTQTSEANPMIEPVLLLVIDMILLAYLLSLHRFILSLAGMDGQMAFGGLGGAREMFLNFVTEINFFLLLAALALRWQKEAHPLLLSTLFQHHATLNWGLFTSPELVVLILVLGILILYEIERIPVGQPATHLELTMSDKAVTLAWRGRDLAWVEFAEMIKVTFLLTLFIALFMPGPWPFPRSIFLPAALQLVLYLAKMTCIIAIIAALSSTRAKLRLTKLSSLAFFAGALSLLSIVYMITTHIYR